MNQRNSKLLRKIAKLTGRTDTYIKSEYSRMGPEMQKSYIAFMKDNLSRIEQTYTEASIHAPQVEVTG